MTDWDEDYDDEDEYEYDESDADLEEEFGPCPECGAEMSVDLEMCPACGYWLTAADPKGLWAGSSPVQGLRAFGKVVLIAILVAILSGVAMLL